jgi:hypothetical protein
MDRFGAAALRERSHTEWQAQEAAGVIADWIILSLAIGISSLLVGIVCVEFSVYFARRR